ncbi:MAG: hypothetical protein ACR2KK_04745 [Acidimicrobiales bacterium]
MPRNWKRLIVFSMAMVVLTSCNGGDDKAGSGASRTTEAPGASTTMRPVDTSFTGQNNAQFCALAKTYSERSSGVTRATTPDQLRAGVQESRNAIDQVAAAAPAEIKSDVQTLVNAFGTMFTELEKANFDPTKVSLTAFAPLQAPEFAQSTTRFQAYLRNVCGIN